MTTGRDVCGSLVDLETRAEPTEEQKWNVVRRIRNELIASASWIFERHSFEREMIALGISTDTTLTDDEVIPWLLYIQALRDIPQTFVSADDVIFPDPPLSA